MTIYNHTYISGYHYTRIALNAPHDEFDHRRTAEPELDRLKSTSKSHDTGGRTMILYASLVDELRVAVKRSGRVQLQAKTQLRAQRRTRTGRVFEEWPRSAVVPSVDMDTQIELVRVFLLMSPAAAVGSSQKDEKNKSRCQRAQTGQSRY